MISAEQGSIIDGALLRGSWMPPVLCLPIMASRAFRSHTREGKSQQKKRLGPVCEPKTLINALKRIRF